MYTPVAHQIGTRFLSELDDFLAQNYRQLRCRDIHDIYFDFWSNLKDFRGTSTGFTGLSEFLIFRFLIHQLGGSFVRQPINKDTAEFKKDNLRLRQSLPVDRLSKRRPDIALFESEKLIAVIQIKIFLVNGKKTFQDEIDTLRGIMSDIRYDFPALLVIFDDYNFPQSLQRADIPQWFSWVQLKDNGEVLHEILDDSLKLP